MEIEIYQANENTNSAVNPETGFSSFEADNDFSTGRDFGYEDARGLFDV